MENIRKPQILIQTDGITNTKIFIDGKELTEYFLSIKILLSLILGMAVPVFTG